MRHFKSFWRSLAELRRLHRYSRDILRGSFQLTVLLYIIAYVAYRLASYAPDYFRCMSYSEASLEIAPVVFAVGVIAALMCDLVMRKTKTGEGEQEEPKPKKKDAGDPEQDD